MPEVLFFLEVPHLRTDLGVTTLTLDPSSEKKTMKMKNVLLSLSLAGLCLSQASAQAPSARHIGDGDSMAMNADSSDQRPSAFRSSTARLASQATTLDYEMLAPTAASYASSSSGCGTGCSGSSCDGSCNSVNCAGGTGSKSWLNAEALLWFAKGQNSPVLATTSAEGVLPTAGAAGVTNAFGGGDGLDAGLLPGFRLSGGMYIGECDKVGIGGRAYGIFSNANEYNATSNGSTSLGVPYFNLALVPPANDAYLVGFNINPATPVSAGSIAARSDLDMIGTDASIHLLLGRSKNHRVDLVGGYSYNKLKNSISLYTQSTNLFTGDLIPDGTVFETNDLFAVENVFNGGHIGVLSSVVQSRVTLSTLTKVSFGNMRQSGEITGSTIQSGGGGPTTGFAGGLFAQTSNIGTFSRDTFAFIPEIGVKLGYTIRPNVQLTVGYTMMMWSSVGLAGEQMDSALDLTQASARPSHTLRDSTFWMQGVDLGLGWTY
jgi:hypothetical protein